VLERIQQELVILRSRWPDLEYRDEGQWVRIPSYTLPQGWNRSATDAAFQIPVAYPGTPPDGFYIPVGLLFGGVRPENYTEPAPTQPPFSGTWGVFSWHLGDGQWFPKADPMSGSNLLNWVIGFAERFRLGK